MARCMARRIRSGVLVGPGTKRKFRPAMRGTLGRRNKDRAGAGRPHRKRLHWRREPEYSCAHPIYSTLHLFSQAGATTLPRPSDPILPPPAALLAELYTVATAAVDPGP